MADAHDVGDSRRLRTDVARATRVITSAKQTRCVELASPAIDLDRFCRTWQRAEVARSHCPDAGGATHQRIPESYLFAVISFDRTRTGSAIDVPATVFGSRIPLPLHRGRSSGRNNSAIEIVSRKGDLRTLKPRPLRSGHLSFLQHCQRNFSAPRMITYGNDPEHENCCPAN